MTETPRDDEETNATTPVSKTENFVSKHFVRLLVWLAVSGGALAIFGPWLLYVAGWTGETDANLRLHILYVTGGTIAVLGLVETHRKNTTDRIKAEADIQNYRASQSYQSKTLDEQARQFTENIAKEREKIEADKAKNEQDYIRQVQAERRIRYTTAIEQLSNDKASIRLGGVYTLVGLVDEWLADEKTIPNIEERRKEGQVIINNLCAYIRSPFLLAEGAERLDEPYAKDLQKDFAGDKEKFDADKQTFKQRKANLEEERQVRQSIIKEIREHLHNNKEPGPWSGFDYDFSNAHFFYPIDFVYSYFGVFSNFSGVTFTEDANFFGAKFTGGADFNEATFTERANFSEAKFTRGAYFSEAKFTQGAYFIGAKFTERADFSEATFTHANFFGATFTQADFSRAKFTQGAYFIGAKFTERADFSKAKFTERADFSRAKFTEHADFSGAKFTETDFSETTFVQAYFSGAKFTQGAYFSGAKFTERADFSEATFTQEAYFSEATFTQGADFSGAIFHSEPSFTDVLGKARFSHKVAPESYSFGVDPDSPCKIEIEEQEHNGTKFIIPKGTILFDPDELSEQEDNNSNDS